MTRNRYTRIALHVALFPSLAFPAMRAQEIKYIDLSLVPQRTELRHPPAPPPNCDKAGMSCVGGGYGGSMVLDGAPDIRDPHAMGAYLLRVTPTEIDPVKSFEAEFRVLNAGLAPIAVPVSPHLSDLQPSDESATFSYFSLALVVAVQDVCPGGTCIGAPTVGFVEMYGSPDQEGSMLSLKPGEWITVKARVKFQSWPSKPVSTVVKGEFWLRRNTFSPHPGGGFTKIQNLYPNATPTPGIGVRLVHAPS